MKDPRVARMASVICSYSLSLKTGDRLAIHAMPDGIPLAREVFANALALGALPHLRLLDPDTDEILYRHGSDEQLRHVPEFERVELETIDARLAIRCESNPLALASVPAPRLALGRSSRGPLLNRLLERKASGELRTCITRFPNTAAAQAAGMALAEYEEFVFRACFLDRADPVKAWQELSKEQQRLADFLGGVRRLRVEAEDTALELSVAGRHWVNSDGKANFPSGEVFTGPVEDSAEGRIRFDIPAFNSGRKVEGVLLEFSRGRVVAARADTGNDLLTALLETDAGAGALGEFAFGLNPAVTRATGEILFDEKIGGTIHLALGAGYPETGSLNRSAIHWDLIKDMHRGRVLADGQTIYENGRFII
uniref:Aminopeptidase n=1 Tax=candidate division WOR-3 bacterium TaxID=2052148 RepID=A0A7C4CAT0_UNCW3